MMKIFLIGISLSLTTCGLVEEDKDTEFSETISETASGDALMDLYDLLASVANRPEDEEESSLHLSVPTLSDDYCDATANPWLDETLIADTESSWAAAKMFCYIGLNSQTKSSALGMLFLTKSLSCVARRQDMFTGLTEGVVRTKTLEATIDEHCFTSYNEALIYKTTLGVSSITGYSYETEKLSSDSDYGFRFKVTDENENYYEIRVKKSETEIAAHVFKSHTDGNEVAILRLDKSGEKAGMSVELLSLQSSERMRLQVVGSLSSKNLFDSIEEIKGFHLSKQVGSDAFDNFIVFNGSFSGGLKSYSYKNGSSDPTSAECQSPLNKSPDCSGADDFSSSSVVAASLYTSFSTDLEALSEYNSKIIKFTNVDPLDNDLTD